MAKFATPKSCLTRHQAPKHANVCDESHTETEGELAGVREGGDPRVGDSDELEGVEFCPLQLDSQEDSTDEDKSASSRQHYSAVPQQ